MLGAWLLSACFGIAFGGEKAFSTYRVIAKLKLVRFCRCYASEVWAFSGPAPFSCTMVSKVRFEILLSIHAIKLK